MKITIDLGERAEPRFDHGPTDQEIEVAREQGKELDTRPSIILGDVRVICHRGFVAALKEAISRPRPANQAGSLAGLFVR